MPDIDLAPLVPRAIDPLDNVVVVKEDTPEIMGLIPIASFARATSVITAVPLSDQANWNPAGFGPDTSTIKMRPTTNVWLTGLAAGAIDQVVTLINDSDFLIALERESGASTAANRFKEGAYPSIWLLPQEAVTLRYSGTLSCWKVVGESFDVYDARASSLLIVPGTGSAPSYIGYGGGASTSITHNNPSGTPTNDYAERGNIQVSANTANATASARAAAHYFQRGATAGLQGIFQTGLVQFNTMGATGALRAGLANTTGGITSLSSAVTQCLFLGVDAGQTNLRVFFADGSAGTPVNLGANFPAPSTTAAYEFAFYAPPGSSFIRYMVRRVDSRFVAEGTLTANLFGNTLNMGPRAEVWVGATAVANTIRAAYLVTAGL